MGLPFRRDGGRERAALPASRQGDGEQNTQRASLSILDGTVVLYRTELLFLS